MLLLNTSEAAKRGHRTRTPTSQIHDPILGDLHIMRESETIVPRKTLSMRGRFDELLYSFNAMTFE
jgi:hypothetical protein